MSDSYRRAVVALVVALLFLAAIPVYGVTHVGSVLDQVVVWGFVAAGFVSALVFAWYLNADI